MKTKKKRLKEEKFYHTYELSLKKKDGSTAHVEAITNTILYRGLYCGFVIFYDITDKKYAEKYRKILTQINKVATVSLTEEEIYSGVCNSLVFDLNFKAASIGFIEQESGKIIRKYICGEEEIFRYDSENNFLHKEIFEGKIVISRNGKNYKSKCQIPLFKSGKVISVMEIFSDETHIFIEGHIDFLREIQRDISFSLDRVKKTRENIIISQALKNSDTWILVTDEKGKKLFS